jgi:hypothetical protein
VQAFYLRGILESSLAEVEALVLRSQCFVSVQRGRELLQRTYASWHESQVDFGRQHSGGNGGWLCHGLCMMQRNAQPTTKQ